jgi:peptidoglycan/xylan/chitin deacetylase (PgdA/CDA1 family)
MFFCLGSNAQRYPFLMDMIRSQGHLIGNHNYSHINGWRSSVNNYSEDAGKADNLTSGRYFRPPYGHMRFAQYSKLRKKYSIFFWDLMPYDFDKDLKPAAVLDLLKRKIRNGSVIVLHDTPESSAQLILDDFLAFALNEGYKFELPVLNQENQQPR